MNIELSPGWALLVNSLFVIALGSGSGFIELISRYTSLQKLFKIKAGWVYIILNGLISLTVYLIIETGGIKIVFGNYTSGPLLKVLLSGTTAMVLLRSSIANVKINDKSVEVGLAPLLQVLLNWVNRTYDRENSKITLDEVGEIMQDVNFEAAERNLPFLCISMMKTLSDDETKIIGDKVSVISNNTSLSSRTKAISLGLHLATYTGTDLLKNSVSQLKEELSNKLTTETDLVTNLMREFNVEGPQD